MAKLVRLYMDGRRIVVGFSVEPIDFEQVVRDMIEYSYDKGGGALAVFVGFVKGVVEGRRVESLLYTAHDNYAIRVFQEIARTAIRKYNGIHEIRIIHRLGELKPGSTTLYILVSGVSRSQTIAAMKEVLERVKHEAPIYKLEKREDGEFWVIGDQRIKRAGQNRETGER